MSGLRWLGSLTTTSIGMWLDMDDHMLVWYWETYNPDSQWDTWFLRVQRLAGHDLDGNQDTDGYSMDTTFDMYREGLTPVEAYARIESSKRDVHREVLWITSTWLSCLRYSSATCR